MAFFPLTDLQYCAIITSINRNLLEEDNMKNASFFIILVSYYLFAAMMLDVISHNGFLHAAILFVISIPVICMIILAFKNITKSDTNYWELFKRFIPSIMGIELILLFFFRLYVLSQV